MRRNLDPIDTEPSKIVRRRASGEPIRVDEDSRFGKVVLIVSGVLLLALMGLAAFQLVSL